MIFAPTIDSYYDLWRDLPSLSREAQDLKRSMSSIRYERMETISLGWRRSLYDQIEKRKKRPGKKGNAIHYFLMTMIGKTSSNNGPNWAMD